MDVFNTVNEIMYTKLTFRHIHAPMIGIPSKPVLGTFLNPR